MRNNTTKLITVSASSKHIASADGTALDPAMAVIAVIGDVHLCWDEQDVVWFDAAGYDLLLFVGDLAGYRRDGRAVARHISQLNTPALVIPGNHDGISLLHLFAETLELSMVSRWFGSGQGARCRALEKALHPVPLCGYSAHNFESLKLSVIAARPHSQGGSYLAFQPYLEERFGIASMPASAERLKTLVAESPHDDVLFLAHNGPTGLGAGRDDIWGCDFRAEAGDFGDPDLQAAIEHARDLGKNVRAVVAGHLHHGLKGGGQRRWQMRQDGTAYVNAARVPRIYRDGKQQFRHHVKLTITTSRTHIEAVAKSM